MTPQYVNPGDRISFPAEFFNSLVDLVRTQAGGNANLRNLSIPPFTVCRVKNSSGADRASLDVLRVTGSELTPTGNSAAFKSFVCVTGSAVSTTPDPFVILAEPVKSGVEGVAFCSGIFPARIYVNDANHTYAKLKASDSTQLDSSYAGPARILYKESGTGTKLAVVQYPVAVQGLIPVRLTQDGGSAGNRTTQCSFTYTVKDQTNTITYGTGIALTGNGNRVVNAAMTAGTYGMAYFDGSTVTLIFADERITQKNCS